MDKKQIKELRKLLDEAEKKFNSHENQEKLRLQRAKDAQEYAKIKDRPFTI